MAQVGIGRRWREIFNLRKWEISSWRWREVCLMGNGHGKTIRSVAWESHVLEECACAVLCVRSFVCWYSCFPRCLSPASISLAYTIFPAYLAFLSKTKINEYFSFGEIEADEISLRFRVFFRRYLLNEITRIKVIFQIVDGEIKALRSISQVLCCSLLLLVDVQT